MRRLATYPALQNGIFLPTGCVNTRITAESGAALRAPMDSADVQREIADVVYALPLGALFASLFRYPSPKGRHCATPRRPSFFSPISNGWGNRREIAQNYTARPTIFDARRSVESCAVQYEHITRGKSLCDASFLRPRSFSPLRPAARPRWSRGSLAQVRGWALQQYWTATWWRVLPSGQRAICSTVSPTPAAVDATATKSHGGRNSSHSHWLSCVSSVDSLQWGASTERGADYGHYSKSSNLVSSIRGVQRSRRVEPHGVRPVFADSDYRIEAFPGPAARANAPTTLTKAQDLALAGPCALSFSDD